MAGAATVQAAEISGSVSADGKPLAAAFVTARDTLRDIAYSTTTTSDGKFSLEVPDGPYVLSAHRLNYDRVSRALRLSGGVSGQRFTLSRLVNPLRQSPAWALMRALPDSEETRRLAIDCMGCHQFNADIISNEDGQLHDQSQWAEWTQKMIDFAGPKTQFPILPPDRTADSTATFVSRWLTTTSELSVGSVAEMMIEQGVNGSYTVTEYTLPTKQGLPGNMDFPHDVMVDADGDIVVTGMFSGIMYTLDPSTEIFSEDQIPTPFANPRALDKDGAGNWWVLLGFPKQLARHTVATGQWDFFDIEMYPHSVAMDTEGRIWFNGHFTNDPVLMGYLDTRSGTVEILEVPSNPMPEAEGGPIPYGMRVAPDGTVWGTELAGNRLVRYTPETGEFQTYGMPVSYSGPRRLDIDSMGMVWIPLFAANQLLRFDPNTAEMKTYDFPVPNSLPYCARVDRRTGVVWISQSGGDAIAHFDPKTETFTEYPMPSQPAFIRHIDIDPESGVVWGAYAQSPGVHPSVVKLEVHTGR